MAEPFLGIPPQALAILMIVFGILVIVLPALLSWLVGILLVVIGVAWLAGASNWPATWTTRRGHVEPPPPRV
jgi:type IV secretory pathway VirB3-like protein